MRLEIFNPSGVFETIQTTSSGSHIVGVADNSDAATGDIGEVIPAALAQGSLITLTTNTPANVTSIILTPGDWEITGVVDYLPAATTTVISLQQASSTTTANFDGTQDADSVSALCGGVPNSQMRLPIPTRRIQVSGPASVTVYLVTRAIFGTSTLKAWGSINARRMR